MYKAVIIIMIILFGFIILQFAYTINLINN